VRAGRRARWLTVMASSTTAAQGVAVTASSSSTSSSSPVPDAAAAAEATLSGSHPAFAMSSAATSACAARMAPSVDARAGTTGNGTELGGAAEGCSRPSPSYPAAGDTPTRRAASTVLGVPSSSSTSARAAAAGPASPPLRIRATDAPRRSTWPPTALASSSPLRTCGCSDAAAWMPPSIPRDSSVDWAAPSLSSAAAAFCFSCSNVMDSTTPADETPDSEASISDTSLWSFAVASDEPKLVAASAMSAAQAVARACFSGGSSGAPAPVTLGTTIPPLPVAASGCPDMALREAVGRCQGRWWRRPRQVLC